jgi:putative endonuclease
LRQRDQRNEGAGMPWVYLVECNDGSFYVGSTYDLERRISEHNEGLGAAYTRRRRPVTLRWSAHYDRVEDAYAAEKRLQGWGRRKRQALIDADFDLLLGLSSRGWAARRARGEV